MEGVMFRVIRNGLVIEPNLRGVQDYSHEWWKGCPYAAEMRLTAGEAGATTDQLVDLFNNYILNDVRTIWRGREVFGALIWSMTLTKDGLRRTKSVDRMANRVAAEFAVKDADGEASNKPRYSYWLEDTESATRYGPLERVVKVAGTVGLEHDTDGSVLDGDVYDWVYEPEWRAQKELRDFSMPTAVLDGIVDPDEPVTLDIQLSGRVVAANRIELSDGYLHNDIIPWAAVAPVKAGEVLGTAANGSSLRLTGLPEYDDDINWGASVELGIELDRLIRVVNHNGGWLYPLDIAENVVEVLTGVSSRGPAMDRIFELGSLPLWDRTRTEFRVTVDGGVIYRPLVRAPTMFWYPRTMDIVDAAREPVSWGATTGYVAIVDKGVVAYEGEATPYVERMSVGTDGVASPHPAERTEGDVYDALREQKSQVKGRKQSMKSRNK